MTATYICPICQNELSLTANIYRCQKNHSFDLAKENYVNLLPVQFKHSKNPGDNKAMVNARRAFLEQGYYQPLINELLNWYQYYGNHEGNVFDAGCGEGFYTHQFKNSSNKVYGVDIAKEAIKKAGKKYKQCHFSVGTLSKLPFSTSFFDWMISVYAPVLENEFTRVLKPGSYLAVVYPGSDHLQELKQRIYDNALPHNEERELIKDMVLIEEKQLNYTMNLATGEDILNLLSMTPFAFKASEEARQWLGQQSNFNCQTDFILKLYQKPI
ncbi:23S rRNA (guanine(745)-N(1))-methyltransferase [Thalassotalea sp. M1531]|uniref:23S rRNA (Guanine(745)-N(1))-methyltransferase n=1 Tax=Thalassotalea algicola TaxID=2716224 RepID=A0A7Y0Q7R2_9GAMM|nr:23S rRNA (guanine(745)-N(1))-methyltransferase [Thalassotalea algicola]NMP32466.1 23S rRNA (guanine(745)-N(1))-methyltransferase [Thalassotalea algicola]